jgi:hypothetical protein
VTFEGILVAILAARIKCCLFWFEFMLHRQASEKLNGETELWSHYCSVHFGLVDKFNSGQTFLINTLRLGNGEVG